MFSIFNLTNTLISRISTRRKEFGILESIGMTKKQIKKMLLHESAVSYTHLDVYKRQEQGSPAQLLHKGGIFAHMVQLQTKSQGWSLVKA